MLPLAEFVRDPDFTQRLTDPRITEGAIHSYLYQAFRFLVMGENDKANGLVTLRQGPASTSGTARAARTTPTNA